MITHLSFVKHVAGNRFGNVMCLAGCLVLAILPGSAWGNGLAGVVDDLVRGAARVTDSIQLKNVDELIAELSKSRAARETVDAELRKAGRLVEGGQVVRGATRSDELLRLLRSSARELDPNILRRLESLDEPSLQTAFLLAKGGDELAKTVPDLTARARLLREGGAETVAAVGMFGPEAARAALRLDEAIRGGSLVVRDGARAVTVADFGKVMIRFGEASWSFWKKYIQPHWKTWLITGALAAYLVNPELFQDALGNLTEQGFKKLTEFAGEVAAAAIRGVGEGSGSAVEKVSGAMWQTYLQGPKGVYAILGTIALVVCVLLLFKRTRMWILRPFRWLHHVPTAARSSRQQVQR